MSGALVRNIRNRREWKRSRIRRRNERSTRTASQSVRSSRTSNRRRHVKVVPIDQNMRTARTSISRGQHDLAGQLVLDVDVELLQRAEFEVCVLRLNGSCKARRIRRGSKYRESIGHIDRRGLQAKHRMASCGYECTSAAESKAVGFSVIGRVLPQALCALAPRGIVVDGITCPNGSLVTAKRLPGQPDARLQRPLIKFDSRPLVRVYSRNRECGGDRVQICFAGARFGKCRPQNPSEAKSESPNLCNSPNFLVSTAGDF